MGAMREITNARKVRRLMREFGRRVRGAGRVYLTGGASAVLTGWRESTVDVHIRLDPEPPGAFEAIAQLKDEVDMNVELASPEDFIPALPGWRERSVFIERQGDVDFYHYDFYAQALSKIERGHGRDLFDVREMVQRGLVEPAILADLFQKIFAELIRYPAIEPTIYREKVSAFLTQAKSWEK